VGVGDQLDRAGAVVRRDRPIEGLGQGGDLLALADPADPADVEMRDVDRAAAEGMAIPGARAQFSLPQTRVRTRSL
jgi:hypothetical protein